MESYLEKLGSNVAHTPGLKAQLHQAWASYHTSLSLCFLICKMDTIITFFMIYPKRVYAIFLKSKTRHDAEHPIPLIPPRASGGQGRLLGGGEGCVLGPDIIGRIWGE